MFVYQQSSGTLWDGSGNVLGHGYSGKGIHKNDPSSEKFAFKGPIPRGVWSIDGMYNSDKLGPHVLILNQCHHDACGRTFFRIHGDSISDPGNASEGCIVLDRETRLKVWSISNQHDRDKYLMVIK